MESILFRNSSANEKETHREHISNTTEAECLECDMCDYKASSKTVLKRHKTMKHKQKTSNEVLAPASFLNPSTIPCAREVFGCKNKVTGYNDKDTHLCPDCRQKLELMSKSSPFSPTLCPCCHDPSGGPPFAFCQECLGYLDEDGCMDSCFGSWNRDNITGELICINLDFEIL